MMTATLVVAALVATGCGGSDRREARQAERRQERAERDAEDAALEEEWRGHADRAAAVVDASVVDVSARSSVLKVTTDLPAGSMARGMAVQVCHELRSAGWRDHIEVRGAGGVLAWTGASNTGCIGRD